MSYDNKLAKSPIHQIKIIKRYYLVDAVLLFIVHVSVSSRF